MDIVIRDMQPADLQPVLELLRHWNLAPIAPSPEIPHPERADFEMENATLAVGDGRVVGVVTFIVLGPALAEGASFAVAPDCQGMGIGKRLLVATRRKMYRRGIRTLRSETDRPEVVRMLVASGCRVVGTVPKRHAFGAAGADHWTVVELDLDTVPELADLRSGESP